MLVLFPINTDAPINYFPAGTITLIVINVVVFILTGLSWRPDLADPWILWFGEIMPHQWLTAFFMHGSFMHLIGNMIFLWAFGLVVEGKLGWWRFIPLYLLLGVSQCAVEQLIMVGADAEAVRQQQMMHHGLLDEDPPDLFEDEEEDEFQQDEFDGEDFDFEEADEMAFFQIDIPQLPLNPGDFEEEELDEQERKQLEQQLDFESRRLKGIFRILTKNKRPYMFGALGASGAIYSLLAMSLVWAPRNEMHIVGIFGYRFVSFEMQIMWFALFYIGLDFLIAAFTGFAMSTQFLHTAGAITGAIFGVTMLKWKRVDCEDWDIFSVLSGNYGSHVRDVYGYRTEKGKKTKFSHPDEFQREPEPVEKTKKTGFEVITKLIRKGDYFEAYEELFSHKIDNPRAVLEADDMKELGLGLMADECFEEAEAILDDYIDAYPDSANWAIIRLAAIQLQQNVQPRAALATVKLVNRKTLTDKERSMAKKVAKAAKQQIEAGVEDQESEW